MKRMTSPDRMKFVNEKNILRLIHENPGICRKEIAERVNVSSQTVTNLVTGLIERKVLLEYHPALGIKGRNPVALKINYSGFYILSCDINIETVSVYLHSLDQSVLAQVQRPVNQKMDVLLALKDILGEVLLAGGKNLPIKACVISVTGVINEDRGIVIEAGKLNWYNLELVKELEYLGFPVLLRNDVNMISCYEKSRYQADENFMVAKLDVGIGSSFVLGGRVLRSTNNAAGELGHVTVFSSGEERPCVCGKSDCLTKFISQEALEFEYGKPYGELVEAVNRKEPEAIRLIERMCGYLAPILANAIILLDLDTIVLCGCSVDCFKSVLYPCLDKSVRKLLSYWVSFKRLEIHSNIKITEIGTQFLLDYYFNNEDVLLFE